jgi:hypothetical protein
MSRLAAEPLFANRRHTKTIYDNVHHNIHIDPVSLLTFLYLNCMLRHLNNLMAIYFLNRIFKHLLFN